MNKRLSVSNHDYRLGEASKSGYRPDIDGLRAVAVLSVVLYHAGFSVFSGGYVGVDVFFVISGYLITRLLVGEIDKQGRVDFSRFYLRRARRLLPALFFTLIVSTVLAVWFLSPQQLESYGGSLIHAVMSISNIFFYSESGYFDSDSIYKPLLHTWSLGVEEQFYFLWPFLLVLFTKNSKLASVWVVAVGVLSFYFCQSMIVAQANATFFMAPFRVYEFAIGAILVWLSSDNIKSSRVLDGLFVLGLALIAYSVFTFDESTRFPGSNALIPCMGAALCIFAGRAQFAPQLLNNRLCVGIGLISYSLYLIHWPLIVFYKSFINSGEFSGLESLLITLVSLAAAIFMYFVIEKTFRKTQASNGRFMVASALTALILCYCAASMWASDGWAWRSWATSGSLSTEAAKRGKKLRFHIRQEICQRKGWDVCDDRIDGRVNALILGDSHAVDALNAFEKIYPNHNFVLSELGGCPPHSDIEAITQPNHPDRLACKTLNEQRFNANYLRSFDYIVINVLFEWYTPEHLKAYLQFLKANDVKKVVVLGDYLVLKRDMYELLNDYGYSVPDILSEAKANKGVEEKLTTYVKANDYFFLSKRKAFCQGNSCQLFDAKSIPFSYDQHHLSYEFAARIALDEKADLGAFLDLPPPELLASIAEPHFSVANWGPQNTVLGVVPNVQPGGAMGIWIKVASSDDLGDAQVVFDGQPALITSVQGPLITAAIAAERIREKGVKEVSIKQLSTGTLYPVGKFHVKIAQ